MALLKEDNGTVFMQKKVIKNVNYKNILVLFAERKFIQKILEKETDFVLELVEVNIEG